MRIVSCPDDAGRRPGIGVCMMRVHARASGARVSRPFYNNAEMRNIPVDISFFL
jgi:hypothetical protein